MRRILVSLSKLFDDRERLAAERRQAQAERRLAAIRYYNKIALPHLRIPED